MALIFDFDGVIVDSERATFELLQAICKRHNITLRDDALIERVGKKITYFVDQYFGDELSIDTKQSVVNEFYSIFLQSPSSYVQPIDYVCDFIKEYEGPQKFAIASVGHRQSIESILSSLEIKNKFKVVLSSEDVAQPKPDPQIYIKACHVLGESPKECLVFEDSKVGATAALAAGCNLYIVLNGLNSKKQFQELPVNGYISSRKELIRVVADLD